MIKLTAIPVIYIFRLLTIGGLKQGPLYQKGKRTSPDSERKEAVGMSADIRGSPR